MTQNHDRRHFIKTSGAASLAMLAAAHGVESQPAEKLRVLCIGVVGSIGTVDRHNVASHPRAEITGLCDVNSIALESAALEHPAAFTCKDYREAFTKYGDRFDAVVVATPDHSHASIMLMAMLHHKHVYGQKPLVHQLEELQMLERALDARPMLCTQMANQRIAIPGRRAAVEILRSGVLGKAISAHVWVSSPNHRDYFNLDRVLAEPSEPPAALDWDLWLCGAPKVPYRVGIEPLVWRSWWDYGSNGLGDWGCHVLDVLFYGYDELKSPIAVLTSAPAAEKPMFHYHPCRSTLTYEVDSPNFAHKIFPIHFSDSGQATSRASLGLPAGEFPNDNMTLVVCENGILALAVDGELEIWRDGKMTLGLEMPGLPAFPEINHWHQWVDGCIGAIDKVRSPFRDGIRITEPGILAVRAARFPNQELRWDRANLRFTNHEEASATLVRCNYREGFRPPEVI